MFNLNSSTLADSRLPKAGVRLALTRKPEERLWRPEDCVVAEDCSYRQITTNLFLAEDLRVDLAPNGSALMVDALRTDKWMQYCEDQHHTADHSASVANVFRDGLLSLRRGLTKITEKTADRNLPNVKTAYRMLDAVLMESYTLDTKNAAEMDRYERRLMGIADMFETTGDELKAEIRDYIREITLDDALRRENKERWPLMFMKAKRLVMNLKRKLAHWENTAGSNRDSVNELVESLLVDADGFRVIAAQAANSRALLGDEGQVDNKDNAVLAWRNYRDALQGAIARPFRYWFRLAGTGFSRAITCLERDDMSGLKDTRHALLTTEACLKIPRIMDTVDAVTLPLSRAQEFDTEDSVRELIHARSRLSAMLTEGAGELLEIEGLLTSAEFLELDLKHNAISEAMNHLVQAEQCLTPFRREFHRSNVDVAYHHLVHANRALMVV